MSSPDLPRAPALPDAFLRLPIAHRGLHDRTAGRPENSRAAVSAAMAAGFAAEIDVQLSADGRAMVFHDYDLGRLTPEKGALRARDADALSRIALLGGDERIPTLNEILALAGDRMPLLIEIKDQDGAMGPDTGALEAAVAVALEGHAGPVAVMSFNPHAVAAFGRHAPGVPRGLVTGAFAAANWPLLPAATRHHLRAMADFDRCGASFVSHQYTDLDRPEIGKIAAAGWPVLCWAIRSPEAEAEARRIADNITFAGYVPVLP